MSIFRPLLPERVLVAEIDPGHADPASLFPEERAVVANAIERRQREFAAGRLLARDLLKSFGCDGPLPRRRDGQVGWPSGVVGSVTHCTTLAAVAIARDSDCIGIGIDVEPVKVLSRGVVERVLTDEEAGWVRRDDEALRVFCAKEAFYKAIYPMAQKLLPFSAVSLEPVGEGGDFAARLCLDIPPFPKGTALRGRWRTGDGHAAAAMVIDSRP
jgi:4'-phosphopantetheinyl transferase EntD